jgi:protein O-GlcNAc transferase
MPKQRFAQCPLCDAPLDCCESYRLADASAHPLYSPALPAQMRWLRCTACAHVFTQEYWTVDGERLLFASALAYQLPGMQQTETLRNQWAPTVARVAGLLCETRARDAVYGASGEHKPTWLDIGFGNGALVMVADEFGFAATGVDVRRDAVERMQALGYQALCADFGELVVERRTAVLSMADVLEHLRDPRAALRKARSLLEDDGLLYISCPNSETCTWRQWEDAHANPYWGELEHYHNFSRTRLLELLAQQGFSVIDYYVSSRYYSCLEVIARKREIA